VVSEQHEDEIVRQEDERLRRCAREQADIERRVDALVLGALTSLVKSAEDLKSRLRRDTEGILDAYRRTKRGLEGDISLAGAERQRLRRDAEQERDAILNDAREQASQVIAEAEQERERLLAEVLSMAQHLRSLERQAGGDAAPTDEAEAVEIEAATVVDEAAEAFDEAGGADVEPAPPVNATATADTEDIVVSPADLEDAPEPPSPPAPPERPVEAPPSLAAILTAPPAPSTGAEPRRIRPRQVRLIFHGVPGYQQAMALDQAVSDLVPDEAVEIDEFEQGRLVLTVIVTDLTALAWQLVAASPASITLDGTDGDRATFRYL